MKKYLALTVIFLITLILSCLLAIKVFARQVTCPDGNGWTKIDSNDLSLYPVSGATQYCFKAGSDNSQGCTGGIFESWPQGEGTCGLSHWSYYIPPTETPTPTPTSTPTSTPTPTPPDNPTPTPTPPDEPTPTPTPGKKDEPTPTPTEKPKEENRTSTSASAPQCDGPKVTIAPIYTASNFTRTDPDTIRIMWVVTDGNAQRYGIYYGLSEGNLVWYTEVVGHDTTSVDLNLVPPGHIWAKVCSIGTCGDQICGKTLDP